MDFKGPGHKMTYLCTQRSDLDKSRYWGYQEIKLYKLVLTIYRVVSENWGGHIRDICDEKPDLTEPNKQ